MKRQAHAHRSAIDELARLEPLPLDPTTMAAVGPVRAALDVVRAHPMAREAFRDASGDAVAVMRYVTAASKLARVTAMEAAKSVGTLIGD